MLRPLLEKTSQAPRENLFWAVVGALIVGQLLAFWLLCSSQVRNAEVHDATLQVQRVALADCLRYFPKATLHGCERRVDPNNRAGNVRMAANDKTADAGAVADTGVPVRVAYHRETR